MDAEAVDQGSAGRLLSDGEYQTDTREFAAAGIPFLAALFFGGCLPQNESNRSGLSVLHRPMKTIRKIHLLVAGLIHLGAGGVSVLEASAPEGGNPYFAIVTQNVFRLRPEMRVEASSTRQSLPPPARPSIRVAGFTDVCGRNQVLLEISEQGKPVVRRVLVAGEEFMGIEAEAINVVAMRARLRINGESSEVTFSGANTPPIDSSGLKLPRK